jgi:RNA polymerase sigma-70 factor (ECF subfamily)
MAEQEQGFSVNKDVRGPWRAFIDEIAPLRPDLHRYCCGLTGSIWDGEDLAQDVLMRVFAQMGKNNPDLENPRAYLIRTATHLWIDRLRRAKLERAHADSLAAEAKEAAEPNADQLRAVREAASHVFLTLAPQERAAVLMKDVLDLSLEETAAMLRTSAGAVKAALHRGRARMKAVRDETPPPAAISGDLVDRFLAALRANDVEAVRALCRTDVAIEIVGGFAANTFDQGKAVFEHAHFVLPAMGLGEHPRWERIVYRGEPIVLGFRTLNGAEGLNEVWRLEDGEDGLSRVRLYCFCPDTLRALAGELGLPALKRPYRSP